MNKRIKNLWIKALRSGKFQQAKDRLRVKTEDGYAYCCLGVLEQVRCEMEGKRFPTHFTRGQVLTTATMKWAGLDDDNPNLPDEAAASMNDEGKSFKYIANRIEKYL
jgi:hypothetical protein